MARLIIGANELLPGTQVITENGVTITPKDGLEVLLSIDDVIPASVTLDSGTSLSQKVHVMNKSGNACTLIYTSQNGTSSIALNTNQAASLVWTGEHWNATFSGLITGTDADGNSINYDTDITLDVAPRSRDDYSTSEIFTGQYWIDGKKIYRKVIVVDSSDFSTETAGSRKNYYVAYSLTDVNECLPTTCFRARYKTSTAGDETSISSGTMYSDKYCGIQPSLQYDYTSNALFFVISFNTSAYPNAVMLGKTYFIVEYTKTTD